MNKRDRMLYKPGAEQLRGKGLVCRSFYNLQAGFWGFWGFFSSCFKAQWLQEDIICTKRTFVWSWDWILLDNFRVNLDQSLKSSSAYMVWLICLFFFLFKLNIYAQHACLTFDFYMNVYRWYLATMTRDMFTVVISFIWAHSLCTL